MAGSGVGVAHNPPYTGGNDQNQGGSGNSNGNGGTGNKGGKDDDDVNHSTGTDTDDIDVDSDNDDEDGSKDDKKGAPSRVEFDKVLKAMNRYKNEAQKNREKLQQLETGGSNNGGNDNNQDTERAVTRAKLEAENEAATKYRAIIGKQAAKAAFLTAGLKGKPDGLLKLIDFDDLEFDDDGEVTGLESQVKQLKSDYPELFTRGRNTGARDKDGSDKPNSGGRKPQSATDIALSRAFAARGN